MTATVGILNLPAAEYHADPCATPSLSSSIANVLVTRSPAHARWAHPKLNTEFEREDKTTFDIGTAAHALLLEGREAVEVLDFPNYKTKAAQEARDYIRSTGAIPLLQDQWENVKSMADAVARQLPMFDVDPQPFLDGKAEQTLIWSEGGVECRALVDWLHDDHRTIDDFKTTSKSASPERWSRDMFGIGCDVQAAFYLRGLRAITGRTAEFRFVVAETFAPYAVSVFTVSPDVLAVADAKIDYALVKWRDCLASGVWPAYPRRVVSVDLPGWEETRWLEREAREAA